MKDYTKLREERFAALGPELREFFGSDQMSQRPSCRSLGVSVPAAAALNAAQESNVPLELLDAPAQSEVEIFRHKLVLVRPDQHVAWRGDQLPEALGPWLERICGRALAEA